MNKVIISDTSCLISFTNLGLLSVLKKIYPTIIITQEVKQEWGNPLPDWFIEKQVVNPNFQKKLEEKLGKGRQAVLHWHLNYSLPLLLLMKSKVGRLHNHLI